jgi:ADP-L-glycero-D-manno-heptose 6-epimerase
MPRYFISGAAGFIGSNLALALEAQGAEVVGVDSFRTGAKDNLQGFRGRFIEADVTQGAEWEGPWDAVFHQGDITDPRYPNDEEIWEKNLTGFSHLLQLARKSGCRLVYASTAGLYGNGPTPMREDQQKQLLTAYGRSKLRMDEIGQQSWEVPVIGLRYFNVFGPREAAKGRAASMVYHLYRQVLEGKSPRLFEWGEQKRDFVYVKDVVQANLCALTAPSGVYNVGTGVASTFNQVVESLGIALGKTFSVEYFPMPYDTATYQADTQADTRLAREQLGFQARWGLRDAVADYVNWLKNEEKQKQKAPVFCEEVVS